jgi:DNA-binding NarL/FixJ family response regulator
MALREAAAAAAAAAAHARSVAQVLDEALAVLAVAESATPAPSPSSPSARTDRLSSREQEVLALVTEGRSNKAIAAALYVSPNTVKTHVASLLNKLHADNRAQLAAIATTRGFLPPHPISLRTHHDTVSR